MKLLALYLISLVSCVCCASNTACDDPTAIQSSTGTWGVVGHALLALDGNNDTNWFSGSCTHTAPGDQDPFLSIDLGCTKKVKKVIITNRMDCCTDRLRNFEIVLTKRPYSPDCRDQGIVCAEHAGSFDYTKAIDCAGEGRFVTVRYKQPLDIPVNNRFLHICEMKVETTVAEPEPYRPSPASENTACGARTEYQSSTGTWGVVIGHASLATDGDKTSNWFLGSCTHTAPDDPDPYLTIDLGCTQTLEQVILTNRKDCCSERLRNFEIVLTDEPYSTRHREEGRVCAYYRGAFPPKTKAVECAGEGRFVTVRYKNPAEIPSPNRFIHICEIEVKLAENTRRDFDNEILSENEIVRI